MKIMEGIKFPSKPPLSALVPPASFEHSPAGDEFLGLAGVQQFERHLGQGRGQELMPPPPADKANITFHPPPSPPTPPSPP